MEGKPNAADEETMLFRDIYTDAAIEHAPDDPESLAILIILARRYANWHTGGNCWPSDEELANKARCSEKTVRRRRKMLEAQGWFKTWRAPGKGICYQLLIPVENMDTESTGHRVHWTKGPAKPATESADYRSQSPDNRNQETSNQEQERKEKEEVEVRSFTREREDGAEQPPPLSFLDKSQDTLNTGDDERIIETTPTLAARDSQPLQEKKDEIHELGEWLFGSFVRFLEHRGGKENASAEVKRITSKIRRRGWNVSETRDALEDIWGEVATRVTTESLHTRVGYVVRNLEEHWDAKEKAENALARLERYKKQSSTVDVRKREVIEPNLFGAARDEEVSK